MSTSSDHVGLSVAENLRTVFAEMNEEVIAVGFDENSTRELVEILVEIEHPPKVRLLGDKDVLKWLRADFVLASTAAELTEADTLEVRAATEYSGGALVVTGEKVVSLLMPDDEHSAAFVTSDKEFGEVVREHWTDLWEDGEPFSLRTPAYSRLLDTFGEEFGSEMKSDFQAALESAGSMDNSGELDEVGLSLLVAAKHEQQLYDISNWGEDTGVASRATYSRIKTQLEEKGLIDTERVPIEVGRPRLRLLLGDERLREAEADELASTTRELLSSIPA